MVPHIIDMASHGNMLPILSSISRKERVLLVLALRKIGSYISRSDNNTNSWVGTVEWSIMTTAMGIKM